MIDLVLPLLVAITGMQVATLVLSVRGGGLTRRMRRRDEYAARSAAYAEQVGGTPAQKLAHALSCFEKLDMADNRRRDFTPTEASLAIHSHLGSKE